MLKKQIILLSFCIANLGVHAQQRKYVNDYLNIGVGARGMGMAGAQVASIGDVTAAFCNPAGLNLVKSDFQFSFMHSEYFSGIAKYDYLGTAFPMKNHKGVIGLSFVRFAIDDIPYTLNLIQPDGSLDYTKIKAISSQDMAGLISYSQKLKIKKYESRDDININVGGNFKIIHRSLGSMANAWGGGLDLGAQATVKRWKLGLVLKDITTTYTVWSFSFTDAEKQTLAKTGNEIVSKSTEVNTPRLILGGGRNFSLNKKLNLLAEMNWDVTTDGKRYGNLVNIKPFSIDPKLGVELRYNNLVYLRGGLGNFQRVLSDKDTNNVKKTTVFQPTLGLGLKIKSLALDYAFSSLNIQGSALYSHFISIKLDINKKGNRENEVNADVTNRADEISNRINKAKK